MEKVVKEEWRDVPGYDGVYQISIGTKEGQCRNTQTGKILSNKPYGHNRIHWILSKNKIKTTFQAARWIALTYPELIENEYFEGAHIDHKNADPMDNRPSNLHWVTQKENNNNPITKERHSTSLIGKLINRSDQSKKVFQYTLDGQLIGEYPSVRQASRDTGISQGSICECCKGNKWHHTAGGYVWYYKEKEA
jgi:hypothetical protein